MLSFFHLMPNKRLKFVLFALIGMICAPALGGAVYRPGDMDGDLDIDLVDLSYLVEGLAGPIYYYLDRHPGDLTANGRVDLKDIASFQNHFGRPRRTAFTPGNVFLLEEAYELCTQPNYERYPGDRIWELDPQTGEVTLFAHLYDEWCGGASAIVFTPDGTRLRVAQWAEHRILELDPDGSPSVLYDHTDGIVAPSLGSMTFDRNGNFYVSVFRRILRFAPDSNVPELFASYPEDPLVANSGAITVDSADDLYYGHQAGGGPLPQLVRFTGPHKGTLIDEYQLGSPFSLQSDSYGHIFVALSQSWTNGLPQILSYAAGDPESVEVLAEGNQSIGFNPMIALEPTETILYVSTSRTRLSALSLVDRKIRTVAETPLDLIDGIAVVPVQNPPYGLTPFPPPIPTASIWGLVI